MSNDGLKYRATSTTPPILRCLTYQAARPRAYARSRCDRSCSRVIPQYAQMDSIAFFDGAV